MGFGLSGGVIRVTEESKLPKPKEPGVANARYEYYKKGVLDKVRYTDASGKPTWDKHYTDHGNSKLHPEVPHYQKWSDGRLQTKKTPVEQVPEYIR
ncbi:MAG: hypothetical protein FWC80_01895 [Firmicutes bacterium]|nr:hypothetical protein [Bacillota bacterium]